MIELVELRVDDPERMNVPLTKRLIVENIIVGNAELPPITRYVKLTFATSIQIV
jgi:hypothetical protein